MVINFSLDKRPSTLALAFISRESDLVEKIGKRFQKLELRRESGRKIETVHQSGEGPRKVRWRQMAT